jgi:hypothetical protein
LIHAKAPMQGLKVWCLQTGIPSEHPDGHYLHFGFSISVLSSKGAAQPENPHPFLFTRDWPALRVFRRI